MTKRYLTIPVVVAGLGFGAANVFATEPQPTSNEALQQKLEQLQAEITQLKTQQQQQQNEATAKSVDQTVERVLRDADKRSQLMQMEGFTAGWNNGRFMLGSADGSFTFMPAMLFQFRSTSNYTTADDGKSQAGFSIPRATFGFDGKIFSNWDYYFRWDSGEADEGGSGNLNLEDAWVQHAWTDQIAVRSGQFVDPVFHEQLVDSGKLLACDRSLMNSIIAGSSRTYTQGFVVVWDISSAFQLQLGYTDGANSANTSFLDFPDGPTNFGVVGRVEWALIGSARGDAYTQFTSMGDKEDLLVVGAGFDITEAGDTNLLNHTVDVQYNGGDGKLSLYGAYVGQMIQNGGGAGITGITDISDNDSYNFGAIVQAGYMLDTNWEIFGRFDFTKLADSIAVGDSTPVSTEDTFNEATVGVNYYFHGHNAKWTADLTWINSAPNGVTDLGILNSDDNQYVFRTQLQLML